MFDTITGLPLHPLLVHALVVALPVMCLVTIAVAVRPQWRHHALRVTIVNGVLFLLAEATERAGKALLARVTQFQPSSHDLALHVQWGDRIAPLALGMTVVAAIVWFAQRRVVLAPYAAVIAIVGGLVTVGVTVYVGDTGARAVWATTIANTKAP